ncbi:glycosyltransferase family 39 protein [Ktedonobacteria bacterium brp13]|nr:glycosyltransferase family 39 protein [Ktedonobacteria bacterium brp13]
MDTSLDTIPENSPSPAHAATLKCSKAWSYQHIDLLCVLSAIITALIPRIVLALQLDMVTDEIVYLYEGKLYLPLLKHLSFGSSLWVKPQYNYEHPPLVKILMGISMALNSLIGHPFNELFAGRIPSIIMGTVLVAAIYLLGRAPFGRPVALIAALALALSPWMSYFSAIAYLDMTMTAFITVAFLLTWHATRRPKLYILVAVFVALGAASKYTGVLIVPGIVLYTAYYFFALRPYMPKEERPTIPWAIWGVTIITALFAFYIVDPAIWVSPFFRLTHSFLFEWKHSVGGHSFFIAGSYVLHVQKWAIAYIVFTKMSAFLTIPAIFFVIFTLVQLIRFHLRKGKTNLRTANANAYIIIWLLSTLAMFSLLNIVVGTHYHLPLAAPVAVAGVAGWFVLFNWLFRALSNKVQVEQTPSTIYAPQQTRKGARLAAVLLIVLIGLLSAGPHLLGLVTVYGGEGYTTEFFGDNENNVLQVAYIGYREAVQWIGSNQPGVTQVGLIAIAGTLTGSPQVNWFHYNAAITTRYHLAEVHPDDPKTIQQYHYLVWPKHLVQRGYALPTNFHVIHEIMGGNTIYCYILEANS